MFPVTATLTPELKIIPTPISMPMFTSIPSIRSYDICLVTFYWWPVRIYCYALVYAHVHAHTHHPFHNYELSWFLLFTYPYLSLRPYLCPLPHVHPLSHPQLPLQLWYLLLLCTGHLPLSLLRSFLCPRRYISPHLRPCPYPTIPFIFLIYLLTLHFQLSPVAATPSPVPMPIHTPTPKCVVIIILLWTLLQLMLDVIIGPVVLSVRGRLSGMFQCKSLLRTPTN